MTNTLCTSLLALALALPAGFAAAQEPLTIAMPTFSEETMLPWAGSGQRKAYFDMVFEYLVYLDPETQEPVPGLATSWEVTPDGKEWTFHLREGVPFSGGHGMVTAEDVAYSIARITDDNSRAGPASPMRRLIAGVETPDPLTVVVKLNYPDFELAKGYFGEAQAMGIVSKAYVESVGDEAANAAPVGTGPYEFTSLTPASEILFTKRSDIESHWRVDPEFEQVRFRLVPEESTRMAMLTTGEADIAPISFDSIPGAESSGLRIVSAEATWAPVVRFGGLVQTSEDRYNADNPWASREVRQALNYAVDKQEIIDSLFMGQGTVAVSDTPVPEWKGIEPYPYDPEKARELLAEAGYPDGFDITIRTFLTTPGAELPLMAEAVALYWADIGVNATIEPVDWPSLRSEWTSGQANNYVWTHRGFPFASPANGLEAGFLASSLFASYSTDELAAMIEAFSTGTDPAARATQFTEIGQYLRDEAAAVFIALANEPYAVSPRVGEWGITTAYVYNFEEVGIAE